MSEKQFKIDTTSEFGSIYINNPNGDHMSWVEVEKTLNDQQYGLELANVKIRTLNEIIDEQQRVIESLRKDIAYYEKVNENRLMNTKGMFDEK